MGVCLSTQGAALQPGATQPCVASDAQSAAPVSGSLSFHLLYARDETFLDSRYNFESTATVSPVSTSAAAQAPPIHSDGLVPAHSETTGKIANGYNIYKQTGFRASQPEKTLKPALTSETVCSPSDHPTKESKMSANKMNAFFKPATVAVIGASESKGVGRTLMMNLLKTPFGGCVFPINPKRNAVLGVKAYPSIHACPDKIELAIIAIPAKAVPQCVSDCVDAGVQGAIILSAGFAEMGAPGRALEAEIMQHCARTGMRVVGPNCLGCASVSGLNATFASSMINRGKVAFFSQSGALCTAVLDYSRKAGFGFSAFVSIGSMLDVDWGDLIEYFGQDEGTSAIVMYMESVGNAKKFVEVCQRVTPRKPVIVLKSGRSDAGAKAASSHTGALAGSDDVCDAVFERAGALRVNEIFEAFATIELFSSQPRPRGPRMTIVTNAGGPGVLTTDALAMGGGKLAEISPAAMAEFNSFLPAAWSHANPVDILGDADAIKYARAVEVAIKDANTDAVLCILTPQDMTNPTATAEAIARTAALPEAKGKLFMCSFMGGHDVEEGVQILSRSGIPNFQYPDAAVRVFNQLHKATELVNLLSEPCPECVVPGLDLAAARAEVQRLMEPALRAHRVFMTEYEAKKVLAAYGLPGGQTEVALNPEQAVEWATKFGFPVVLKLHSETITHKSDVGGVKLGLQNGEDVRRAYNEIKESVTAKCGADAFLGCVVMPMIKLKDAYEIILGCNCDPTFGPTVLFGLGGILVEVFKDKALGLAPVNRPFAQRLLAKTKIFKALQGVRGKAPVNIDQLIDVILRFSQLVSDHPLIRELDINPLLCSPDGILALDARIILADLSKVNPAKLSRSAVPSARPLN
ncbi:acetyl-CoA synthetase [Paratrimastix pyriformis]|uniref:Acetyl-CoA synthetase n=1 Tax=Paratrimastix pyriformis TaxID=342808 RepID=A0ABQ8UX06_9EUKA|nr:acetyl-CoA synthetase [Paratrimastix pyriformis]